MMRQRMVFIIVTSACMTLSCYMPVTLAEKSICTETEAQSAEVIVASTSSWVQLYQQFERYGHCDDGAIAEGFSESISLLLAEQWSDIQQLDALLIPHSKFREFIINHIDETVPVERLERIGRNARERCLRGLEDFCREIELIQILLDVKKSET